MAENKKRSVKIRALNAICSSILICSVLYVLIAGVEAIALGAIAVSLVGAATPVVISGEGILGIFSGIIEALFDGVMLLVEGIANAISALFG